MELANTPEEWEQMKDLFRQLYALHKSPEWTLEKQLELNDKIKALERFK